MFNKIVAVLSDVASGSGSTSPDQRRSRKQKDGIPLVRFSYMQLARTEAVKRAIKEGCLNPSNEDAVFQVRRSVPQVMKLTLHGHINGVFHRLK